MRGELLDPDPLLSLLKQLIAEKFQFSAIETDGIATDEPLIGGRLGFDDLDALELGMYVEEEFGLTPGSTGEARLALTTIASLADFIRAQASDPAGAGPTHQPVPSPEWSSNPAAVSSGLRLSSRLVER